MSMIDVDLQLHLRRSQCIDAFVAIELEIAVLQSRFCPGYEAEQLSQKIARLKKVPAGPTYSKRQRTALHEVLSEAESVMPLRHDIVHGTLSVLKATDVTVAAFVNVREATRLGATARLFTTASLDELSAMARAVAARLRTALDKDVAAKTGPAPAPPDQQLTSYS